MAKSVLYIQKLMHSDLSAYSAHSKSAHSATPNSDSSEETKNQRWHKRAKRFERAEKTERKKKQARRTKRRIKRRKNEEKKLLPIYQGCRYCKRNERRTPHPKYPEERCFFNKRYKGWRPCYACKIVRTA